MGIPFDGVVLLYENKGGGFVTAIDIQLLSEAITDPTDPNRNFPVLMTTEADIQLLHNYGGGHPGHAVLNGDREIVYLGEGHGVEAATRQAIIDDWNANGGR